MESIMKSSNGNIFIITGSFSENSLVTGEFPSKRPVTQSFDVFFDLHQNTRLSKQSRRRWFETLSRSLWRHSKRDRMYRGFLTKTAKILCLFCFDGYFENKPAEELHPYIPLLI